MKKIHSLIITVVLVVVCFFAFFVNNGALLPDIMESRNIITAREMVYDGNWTVPTMNGELRLEKPPLPTWFAALAEIIAPDSVPMQRAMSGLAACLLVFAFFKVGAHIFRSKTKSFIATLVLCTCYNVVLQGRTATWDIYTHAFMMLAIWQLINAFEAKKGFWPNFILAGIFIGLSFMSKGPISLFGLFLPFILTYFFVYYPKMEGKIGATLTMVLVAVVVGCSWYAYIYAFNGDAMAEVAARESANWSNHNVRPFWYYWDFFLEAGVWALILLCAISMIFWSDKHRHVEGYMVPFIWMTLALILLSIPGEKKTRYLFPMMIPISYLIGFFIYEMQDVFDSRKDYILERVMFKSNAWILALIIFALPFALYFAAVKKDYLGWFPFIMMTLVCIGVGCYMVMQIRNYRPVGIVYAVVALFIGAEVFALPVARHLVQNPDLRSISVTYDNPELRDIPFRYNPADELRIEMVYRAHKKIRPIDVSSADSLRNALPFVMLTHKSVSEELAPEIFEFADTTFVGHFDDNLHPASDRHYTTNFVYNVTLLTPKD
ncbi:MAG: glycosyltransferase family 39 protein [Bacteroidales bacterium]|nr:glycosyltransferase family 39 protein [Bacteroidales bacterium]